MPSISRKNVAAGTANALDGLPFQVIDDPGALVTLYGSGPTAGIAFGYAVGNERFLVAGEANIEGSADVVAANGIDKLLDREPVPGGKQFLSVEAQIGNFLLVIEQLPG